MNKRSIVAAKRIIEKAEMMRTEPILSIAILNWNGHSLLEKFIPSVMRYSLSETTEIVVIDNGSTDDSCLFIETHYPEIKLIKLDKNYGFAEGYNRGIEEIKTPFICLLNSDVAVTEGWTEAPLKLFLEDETIAAIQPKIRSYHHPELFEYAGAAGGFIDAFGYPYCRGRLFDTVEEDKGQYDTELDLFWATGAAMFVRRESYLQAGGLDVLFFAHMEEIDLSWRLLRMGYRIVYTPKSVVFHVGGASLESGSAQKVYLNFRNNLLMLYKNLPPKRFRAIFAIRLFLDPISALVYLIKGKPQLFLAVLRAHRDFFRRRKLYPKRGKRQIPFVHSPSLGSFSIVWHYFIRNQKHFSQLPLL